MNDVTIFCGRTNRFCDNIATYHWKGSQTISNYMSDVNYGLSWCSIIWVWVLVSIGQTSKKRAENWKTKILVTMFWPLLLT